MQNNIDIIILTAILTGLFIFFSFIVIKEIINNEFVQTELENSPRANLLRLVGSLFDEDMKKDRDPQEREIVYRSIKRTIADMESGGVYFPEKIEED